MHVLLAPRKRGQKLPISLLISVLMFCSLRKRGSGGLVMRRSVQIWHLRVSQRNRFPALRGEVDSLLPHFSWTTSLPFCHTSFELIHATLTLTQKTLHFYTLYRPPPNRKNKLTDPLFFEQFPDLLEHCNSLAGNSFILGDFNFHYDCPLNPYTSRLNDLLSLFTCSSP